MESTPCKVYYIPEVDANKVLTDRLFKLVEHSDVWNQIRKVSNDIPKTIEIIKS